MKKQVKAAGSQSHRKEEVLSDPFIFPWFVNEAGYQWAPGLTSAEPRLVKRFVPGARTIKDESPKEAFVEFAKLEPSENAIREFADRYGDLFESYSAEDVAAHDGRVSGGASLSRWQKEIGWMRVLYDLWADINKRRLTRLGKIIKWSKNGKTVEYSIETSSGESSYQVLVGYGHGRWGMDNFTERDVVLPARYALQLEVNKRLMKYPTVPRLNWTPDMLETSGGYSERLIFRPPNLLSAMWLRFAEAITKGLEFRQCVCGRFFQIGPGSGRRADAQYHEDICRVRAWKGRNKPVNQLMG